MIPWGLEPQSKEPESFILSIELRNQLHRKGNKKCGSFKKRRLKVEDFCLLLLALLLSVAINGSAVSHYHS